MNNVEKFNEPIKLTKNSTGKDLESFKAGEKYKVIFSYKEIDKDVWLPAIAKGDVEPLSAPTMPRNCFNTVQAKLYMGKGEKITVCGTVVSTRESRSGNIWLNLDKKYPNQIFSAYIKKEHIVNFPYSPEKELLDKKVCLKGEVADFSGKPTMRLDNDKVVEYFNEK